MSRKHKIKHALIHEMDKIYMRFIHRPTVSNYRKLKVIMELIVFNALKKKKK